MAADGGDVGANLRALPTGRVIRLHNGKCPYCGCDLSKELRTKEHVVGRNFVPRGSLDRQWNLILWACLKCNNGKSDVEDEIAAVSMQPDSWGRYADDDPLFAAESERKGKGCYSRRTGKPVRESQETISVSTSPTPGLQFTLTMTAPPQSDPARVYELARLHARAFFFWVTYNAETKSGRWWRGVFLAVHETRRSDWGNGIMRGFADAVVGWEPRVLGITAGEMFRAAIRKHPDAACWSWAFEYNSTLRAVGFFGDEQVARGIVATFPRLPVTRLEESPTRYVLHRNETPLNEADDRLFHWNGWEAAPSL